MALTRNQRRALAKERRKARDAHAQRAALYAAKRAFEAHVAANAKAIAAGTLKREPAPRTVDPTLGKARGHRLHVFNNAQGVDYREGYFDKPKLETITIAQGPKTGAPITAERRKGR